VTQVRSALTLRPMLGQILMRVVFVEGPGSAALTDAERRNLLTYVHTGAKHLLDLHNRWRAKQNPVVPAGCAFTVTSQRVSLTLDPASLPKPPDAKNPTHADFEAIDVVWIDAALETLGYSKADTPRLEDRVAALAADATLEQLFAGQDPADSYVVFVTKYPCHWMGYTMPEGFCTLCPPMLDHGGWKDRYDLVVAHETGHVFGAPDEYVNKNLTCNPNLASGPFGTLNVNCELNNPRAVRCLMRRSDLDLCDQTPLHWGWWDGNRDGVLDLLAPPTIDGFTVYDPVDQVWIPGGRAASSGWSVTIKGRNAWDARSVTFGGVPSRSIWRLALDEISVTVPDGVSGIVTVDLVTRAGPTNATFEQSWFLVAEPVPVPGTAPVVFGLVPSSGAAGTKVKILGAGLFEPTSITFGGVAADLSGLPAWADQDPSRVDVAAPVGPAGAAPVVVTTAGGSSEPWLFSTFTYT
jgi:hypothetical protein